MISLTGYKILMKLIENKNLASGAFLSESCNLSINTIRNEIDKLNDDLKQHGCNITSHIANGYRLVVSDERKLEDMMKQYRRYAYLNIPENTISYHIVRELLSTSRYLSIESFMDELSCSRSTVVRILDKARKYLDQFDLKIINKKNHGMQIEGSEWNKRLCLIKQEKIKRHDETAYDNEGGFEAMFLLNTEYKNRIRKIIIDHFSGDPSFSLSQIELPEIFNMAILNYTRKQYLKDDEAVLQIDEVPTLDISRQICMKLPEEMKEVWGENEIRIFAILIASMTFPSKSYLEEHHLLDHYIDESKEVVSYLRQYFELPEAFDDLFHDNMAAYLFHLEQQLKFSKSNDSESLSSSFARGIITADICSCLGLWYYEKHGALLTDKLLVPAYHIINRVLFKNRSFYRPFRVAVMSRYGLYYSQNIAERLKRRYSFYIKEVVCIDFCYLESYDWSSTDLLLSDMFINLMPVSPPNVITIPFNAIHDEELFDQLDVYLDQYVRLDALELFPKENMIHSFAQNMDEVYDEVYAICKGEVGDKERFIKDLQLHERMSGKSRVKGIVCMSTCALRTEEALFSLIVTQKEIPDEDSSSSVFIFYSYGDGSMKNRYLISWLVERFYMKKEDWLNTLFRKEYQAISQEL